MPQMSKVSNATSNSSSLRCTIPSKIAAHYGFEPGDILIWDLGKAKFEDRPNNNFPIAIVSKWNKISKNNQNDDKYLSMIANASALSKSIRCTIPNIVLNYSELRVGDTVIWVIDKNDKLVIFKWSTNSLIIERSNQ